MSILAQLLPKKEQKEYFLTLCLSDHLIRCAIAQIVDATITVIGHGEAHIGENESAIIAADKAVTHAEQQLPHGAHVGSVVFALPQYYLDGDQVLPAHVETIKSISTELDLAPKGYIEYPGAIAYYLEKEEGSPPTLLLVALEAHHYTFTLLRLGKVQQQTKLDASGPFSEDFSLALSHLSAEILPSRILLYDNGKSLEHQREELLKFPWHKHAQFIHTPKVEIFPPSHLMAALIEAGASSFLRTLPAHRSGEKDLSLSEPMPLTDPGPHARYTQEVAHQPHTDVSDVLHKFAQKVKDTAQETIGFSQHVDEIPSDEEVSEDPAPHTHEPAAHKKQRIQMPSLPFSFRIPSLRSGGIYLLPLLVLLLGIGWLVWDVPKATISLGIYPISLSQEQDITFVSESGTPSDSSQMIVSEPQVQVHAEKTIETTGIGKIGESAKGTVTLYNKTTTKKTFPKGTILTNGNLAFTLSSDVTVASASDTGEGLSFGKENAPIVASAIGPASNLAANSTFVFKDFSEQSYTAKNSEAFRGGISKDVTTVSREDQKKLETAVTQELLHNGTQQLRQSLASGEQLLDQTIQMEDVSKKFSADVGTEAKEISLSLSATVKGKSYQESQILSLASQAFSSLPDGYESTPRSVSAKVVRTKKETSGDTKATIQITATFLPKIDTEKIQADLSGKTYENAQTYLSTFPHIGIVRIHQSRTLPLFTHRLPINRHALTIQTVVY